MAPSLVVSIHSALYHLDSQLEYTDLTLEIELSIGMLMHKLKVVKTFLVCLGNDNTESSLGNVLVRVDEIVSRILETKFKYPKAYFADLLEFLVDIESLEEELHKRYRGLSVSSSREANQVIVILDSVLQNLNGFLSFPGASFVELFSQPIEALKQNIAYLRNFIRFSTLLSAEHQEYQDVLSLIEGFAICASDLTLHLFSADHYNFKVLNDDVPKPILSELLRKIKRVDDPHLHEACVRALESIKNSRELYVPAIDLRDFPTFLLCAVWEMLQLDTGLVVSLKDKLQALYEGVRFLRTIFKKQPRKLNGKIRDYTGAAIFDTGVMILSLHRKDFAIDLRLKEFQVNIQMIKKDVHGENVATSAFGFPKSTVLGFLDFLLDYLTEVKSSNVDVNAFSCVPKIQDYLVFLRWATGKLVELRNEQKDLHQALWDVSIEVAYKIEFLIDQLVLGNIQDSFSTCFQSITEDIMILQTDSMSIFDKKRPPVVEEITWVPSPSAPEDVVGFEIERSSIINRLMRGISKKLQVVAIVGMPGLGKTTLATKVFNDSSVTHHFQVRAWCAISQVFNKKRVLLDLLNQISPKLSDMEMDENDLAQALRRSLKGRRYLIFLDDVWDVQAFHCLKGSFQDDCKESRIIITSRHCDVASLDEIPLFLPQFTSEESLELLQKKLFPARKDWPPELREFGIEVAGFCKGLPLTVVIVAGLLKTTGQEVWKEILESLKSGIITNADQCKSTIELSYKYLPDHLKPCFLSFAAFREDQEISVKRLLWLWIAEGFIQKSESKMLEEVAADYLNSLIGRSLVINAKERSISGGVKTCRVHDLLHDFCSIKANEEGFLSVMKGCEEFSFDEPGNMRRLCIDCEPEQFIESMLFVPRLRSLSFLRPTKRSEKVDMSFIGRVFKLLRVLDSEHVKLTAFPCEQGLLLQLRYLTIKGVSYVSPSIGNLSNLETFILYEGNVWATSLPDTFWNLRKLRHLNGITRYNGFGIILPVGDLGSSSNLPELSSLSNLRGRDWDIMEKQLRKFPGLRQLKSWFKLEQSGNPLNGSKVISFAFLTQLESVNLSFNILSTDFELIFPENLKKLTLSMCELPWRMISTIAELPNLEVLKLRWDSFCGDTWHVEEGEFPKLKFLELSELNVMKWTASDEQFPNLEKLVLDWCDELEEIPECLENAVALKWIEVKRCSDHVASLVKSLEEHQKDYGNSDLKVLIEGPEED